MCCKCPSPAVSVSRAQFGMVKALGAAIDKAFAAPPARHSADQCELSYLAAASSVVQKRTMPLDKGLELLERYDDDNIPAWLSVDGKIACQTGIAGVIAPFLPAA